MANLYERDFQNQRPLPGARIGIREELSDLILNVDGAIAVAFVDLLRQCDTFTKSVFQKKAVRHPYCASSLSGYQTLLFKAAFTSLARGSKLHISMPQSLAFQF